MYGQSHQQQYGYPPQPQHPQYHQQYDGQSYGAPSYQPSVYSNGSQQPYYSQSPAPPSTYSSPPPQYHNDNYYAQNPVKATYPPNSGSADPLKPNPTSSAAKINTSPKYQDVWASVLFLMVFAGYIVCLVVGIPNFTKVISSSKSTSSTTGITFTSADVGILIGGAAGLGFVLSGLYMTAIYFFAGKMIKASMVLSVLYYAAAGVVFLFFVKSSIIYAVIMFLLAAFQAWFFYKIRHRIPFTKVLLKTVTSVMGMYPATIFAGFVGMIFQLTLSVSWFVAVIGIILNISATSNSTNSASNSAGMYAAITFLCFSLFFISQVVKNVVHVTVSGLFATYYFMGISTGQSVSVPVSNPTAGAAKRALTTSFGSICFGSLVIAIIQTLRSSARSASDNAASEGNFGAAFCGLCVTCLLSCIEDIIEYLNHYAFTQVAIYGKSYCESAKATWKLVKSKGIDAIINDSLVNTTLFIGSMLVSLIGAAYGAIVVSISTTIPDTATYYALACIMCFFVVSVEFSAVAEVVTSGDSATFVCLAEDPMALQRTKPELFEKIRHVYPNVAL